MNVLTNIYNTVTTKCTKVEYIEPRLKQRTSDITKYLTELAKEKLYLYIRLLDIYIY